MQASASGTGVFLRISQKFLEHLFDRTPLVAASLFTLRLLLHRYHHYNTIKFNESFVAIKKH